MTQTTQRSLHVLELFREAWECPVCLCFFTDPAVLECGHTFCRSCLKHVAESARTKTNSASPNTSNASSTNNMINSLSNSAMNASSNNPESGNFDSNNINTCSAASSTTVPILLCPTCRLPTAHTSLEKIPPNYSLVQTLASVRYCSFCSDVCEAYCGACEAFLCHEHKDEHAGTIFTKAHVLNGHVVSYAEYTIESRKRQQLQTKGSAPTTTSQSATQSNPTSQQQQQHSHPQQSPQVIPPHAPSPNCVPNGCPLHTNPHLSDSTSASNKPPSHSPNNNRSPYPYPNHHYPTWAYPPPQQPHWGPYGGPPPGNYPGPQLAMNAGGMNSSMSGSSMGMGSSGMNSGMGSGMGGGMGGNRG